LSLDEFWRIVIVSNVASVTVATLLTELAADALMPLPLRAGHRRKP